MLKEIFTLSNYYLNLYAIPVLLVSIAIFFIGFFVLFQNKRSMVNIAFFLKCFSAGFWLFTVSFVYFCSNEKIAHILYKYLTFFGVANIGPNLYMFSVYWSGASKRQRLFIPWVFAAFYLLYGVTAFSNIMIKPEMRHYFWGLYPIYKPAMSVFVVMFTVTYVISVINAYRAYQIETIPIKKSRNGIITLVLSVGYLGSIDFISKFFNITVFPIGYIAIFSYISLVAYSIVRYRAFDIETVLHKTILWLFSFSFILLPVFGLYRIVFPYISGSVFAQFLFWTLSFGIFSVYSRVIQPKVDHLFQRRKANLEQISNKLIDDLVLLKGLNNLIVRIKSAISESLYPQHIDVFIYNEDEKVYALMNNDSRQPKQITFLNKDNDFFEWLTENNAIVYKEFIYIDPQFLAIRHAAKKYFKITDAIVAIPLVVGGRLLGIINLGKKASLKRYTATDFQFLNTLKNESAIAISNSLLYDNMEAQVRERSKELSEVQNQLVQAEKMATVGTLAGGVAHEINNPLTGILTSVQMLLDSDDIKDEDDKESLELIEEATKRCRVIVQKLMVYARKPTESTEITSIDFANVVKSVIAFLKYQLQQENIEIDTNISDDQKFMVDGNHNELEHVITNIILNAKDTTKKIKKSGTIGINIFESGEWIKLEISDLGEGIPEDIRKKIFDPFFTTKDVGEGLGLGLSICHSIIERHNGFIEVKSQLGQGSVFIIKLFAAKMGMPKKD